MFDLAVVLISKNQEWNIARLIESVLKETTGFNSKEVVLVDSASTDKTIEIARRYQINIIRLKPDQRLTAAAGRYVGYQHTSAELCLFLDGDMQLCEGWLEEAVSFLYNHSDVAVITGELIETPKSANFVIPVVPERPGSGNSAIEVLQAGGAADYRRSVLRQVGTFTPYLYSDEEPELCIRIRRTGYRILKLECPIAYHFSGAPDNFLTLLARWRRNLYVGSGQNIRYLIGTDLLWPYLIERGHGILPGLGLLIGLLSLLLSIKTHQWRWFGFWLALVGIIIVADAYRKRSMYLTFSSTLKRLLILHGTVKGFLLKPLNPDTVPIRFDIIEWQCDEVSNVGKWTLAECSKQVRDS